jgi:hypothetical protein
VAAHRRCESERSLGTQDVRSLGAANCHRTKKQPL